MFRDIRKLPKWAQKRIEDLKSDVNKFRELYIEIFDKFTTLKGKTKKLESYKDIVDSKKNDYKKFNEIKSFINKEIQDYENELKDIKELKIDYRDQKRIKEIENSLSIYQRIFYLIYNDKE